MCQGNHSLKVGFPLATKISEIVITLVLLNNSIKSYQLIEQIITTPILYNNSQFGLTYFIAKNSTNKIQQSINLYLQQNLQKNWVIHIGRNMQEFEIILI